MVSREDSDLKQGCFSSGALQPPGNQPGMGVLAGMTGTSPPLPRPMLNGHCVWFPAVASSSARTLAFLPQPEASPLVPKQQLCAAARC